MGKFQALYDGILTGWDPIGTAIGHRTNNKYFVGYVADKYSFNKVQSILDQYRALFDGLGTEYREPESIDRSVSEQIFKGLGTSIGIVTNVIIFGLPQIFSLSQAAGKHYQKKRTEEHIAPLVAKLLPDHATEHPR